MNAAVNYKDSRLIIYGLPAMVSVIATTLSLTKLPAVYPELSIGILIDLTISAPLFLLLLSRNCGRSKLAVAAFFFVGVAIASFTLPAANQYLVTFIMTWIPLIAEGTILAVLGYSTYKAVKAFNTRRQADTDILTVLDHAASKMVGDSIFARFLAYEVSVFYYSLICWKKTKPKESQFTYHKKSGTIAVGIAFAFIIAAEAIVFHYLIALFNIYLAWVITISSVYTILLIIAQIKASTQRLIEVEDGKLFVRYGLFGETEIDLKNIDRVETSTIISDEKTPDQKKFGIFEQCNTRIILKREANAYGFYRFKTQFMTLVLHVDENEKLKKLIAQNVSN